MQTLGRYRLLARVAVGGMAEIFLARSASLDGFEKDLVVKRIRPELSANQIFASLFINEAKISIALSHQNLVQVFDFGQVDGFYYLAMEHVHGCDLAELLELDGIRDVGIDPAVALFIMREVCRGLDYAHNRKNRKGEPLHVVHRDISPQNIMVSFGGDVKIMDFGIAKALGCISHTEPGFVMGKLSYMSPEQAVGQPIDQRTDIFACGVVLWELLVGKRVYCGEAGPHLFERIRNAQIDRPSRKNSALPGRLDGLVMRAVACDPVERYQTAREFGAEIHGYLSRHHPDFSSYHLEEFLAQRREEIDRVSFENVETEATPAPGQRIPVLAASGSSTPASVVPSWPPNILEVVEVFRQKPSVWQLAKLGDVCAKSGEIDAAVTSYRVAAIKFAQRGLFAQSLLCCSRLLRHRSFAQVRPDLIQISEVAGQDSQKLAPLLFPGQSPMESLLQELLADVDLSCGLVGEGTPLLRHLRGEAFADFAQLVPLRYFEEDTKIVEQGQRGRTMYLIAVGRALVYADRGAGERVYLSSLTAGDFFGENGFFTGAPRSATVETLYPTEAFELDLDVYARLMKDNREANAILLRFYKERIVDVVLAKSPVFGLLPCETRRALVEHFELKRFSAGDLVIEEGELNEDIYLVKDGEAEVYTDVQGEKRVLAVLGPGTLFGEVAALQGVPRTATVRARCRLETMRLAGSDFQLLLMSQPDIRERVLAVINERERENLEKLS